MRAHAPGLPGLPGPPLLLVGHGTRSAAGVAEFGRLVERVRDRRPGPGGAGPGGAGPGGSGFRPARVAGGFIELSEPPVAEAMSRLAEQAAGPGWEVVAVPLVLTAAGHGKGDIPAALAREQLRHPGLSYRYGRPLGPHPALLTVLETRIDAALAGAGAGAGTGPAAGRRGTHVLLTGRGSTDPDGNAEVAKVARLLWEGRGYAGVEYAFISLAEPSVPAALERTRRLGAERIVIAPYFLFPGVLPDRTVTQAREYAAAHPVLDVRTAGVLGACDELADLVLDRYAEALTGDIRMNCDTCAYRVALPGFADKAGRPQTPHFHPAENLHSDVHRHPADDRYPHEVRQ